MDDQMTDDSEQLKAISRILDHKAAEAMKMELVNIIPAFDQAESECLALQLTDNLALEVKRRVAEWKLKLSCDLDAPFENVHALHCERRQLGYSNLENEVRTELYFAQYCERKRKHEIARQLASSLLDRLDGAIEGMDSEIYSFLKGLVTKLLDKVDSKH